MREDVSREEARKRIESLNEPYKLEILDGIKEEPITIYHIGKEKELAILKCVILIEVSEFSGDKSS